MFVYFYMLSKVPLSVIVNMYRMFNQPLSNSMLVQIILQSACIHIAWCLGGLRPGSKTTVSRNIHSPKVLMPGIPSLSKRVSGVLEGMISVPDPSHCPSSTQPSGAEESEESAPLWYLLREH